MTDRFQKRVGASLLSQGGIQVLGIVSGALLARLLGVEDRGIYATIILWPTIISTIGDLGGPAAYVFLAAAKQDLQSVLLSNSLVLVMAQTIMLGIVGIPLVILALPSGETTKLGLGFLLFFLPLNLFNRYLRAMNQGLGDFKRFNWLRIAIQLTYAVGMVILFASGVGSMGWVLAVVLMSNFLVAVLNGFHFYIRLPFKWSPNFGIIRKTFRYGAKTHLGSVSPVETMQLDLVVITLLLSPESVGLYVVASSVANVVRGQGTAIGMVVLPHVASSSVLANRRERLAHMFRVTILIIVGIGAAIWLLSELLIPVLYGPDFSEAINIARVLIIGAMVSSLKQVLGDGMRGMEFPGRGSIAEAVGGIAALVGLLTLAPHWGLLGAAVAVSLGHFASFTAMVVGAAMAGITVKMLLIPRWNDIRQLLRIPLDFARRGSAQ